jgi:carboxymethylenebutenolidase
MGEWIKLKAADGFELSAWREMPEGKPRGGVVVVQEIFGVNHHIRSVAHRLAAAGYVAIAPAIFDRYEPGFDIGYDDASRAKAFALMPKLDRDKARADVAAALEAARKGGKVGVVGFCLGGALAWASSALTPGVDAAVGYYGNIIAMKDLALKAPTQMHFGEKDGHIPADEIRTIAKGHKDVGFYYYPADHGFGCDERSAFDAESSAIAWGRTLEFFGKHLG